MGGAVLATAGAAAWAVGRGDSPVGCSLCQGTGGCSCFACSGSGNPASSSSSSGSNSRPLTMEEVAAAREAAETASGGKPPAARFLRARPGEARRRPRGGAAVPGLRRDRPGAVLPVQRERVHEDVRDCGDQMERARAGPSSFVFVVGVVYRCKKKK